MIKKFTLFALPVFFWAIQSLGQKSYQLSLVTGQYSVEANLSKLKWEDVQWTKATYNNHRYALIQFFEIPDESLQKEMERAGIFLLSYLPEHCYVAKIALSISEGAFNQYKVRAVMPMQTDWKLSANLKRWALVPEHAKEAGEFVKLNIKVLDGESRNNLASLLKDMELEMQELVPNLPIIQVKTKFSNIDSILAIPLVEWVEPIDPEIVPYNLTGVTNHRAGILHATHSGNRGLLGQGVTVGVGDGGYVRPHFDFDNNRLININVNTITSFTDHGDHVAGTVGGGGVLNPAFTGMAPKSTLITQQTSAIVNNASSYFTTFGMVLTNNSYGFQIACPTTGGYPTYTSTSNFIDNQLRSLTKVMHCFAASNDGGISPCGDYSSGFGTISLGYGTAKNALVVGAVSEADVIAGFSSRGPTADGRVKPEIMGVGTSVVSTIPHNLYGSKQGTSMATPGVTGTLALLYERFRQLNNGQNPDAALIKATACNTADDIGNPQVDYRHGYGRINALRAVKVLENQTYYSNSISQGNTQDVTLTMPSGLAQVRIMLYWHDRQANSGASPSLVNNLNLEVINPSAVTFNPWVLNPAAASVNSNAVRGVDNLNNIEQVTIDNPPAGNYTIRVSAPTVPFGPQDYYVVYEYLQPSITVTYPVGGEVVPTTSASSLRWDAFGLTGGNLILEYSTNNGTNWVTISSSLSIADRRFSWNPGAAFAPTNTALIRVRHSASSLADQSDSTFTLCGMPTVTVNNCDRQGFINWTTVTGASSYEIFHFPNGLPELLTTTPSSPHIVTGLINGVEYFYAVGPVFNPTIKGQRTGAVRIIPTTGTACPIANDVGIYSVLPASGREFTSSQLSANQSIQVTIKNYGTNAQSGINIPVFYRINNEPVQSHSFNGTLVANGVTSSLTFPALANMAATGTYLMKAWTELPGDQSVLNDTLKVSIKHLPNPPVTLPVIENFESLGWLNLRTNTVGLEGSTRLDYAPGSSNSRLRTGFRASLDGQGTKTITLDRAIQSTSNTVNHLIYTLNLSNHSSAGRLLLNFDYTHHGETASNTNDRVWARGTDAQAWVQVYDLFANQAAAGTTRQVRNLDIRPLLGSQTIGTSFQIRFGQEGPDVATAQTMKSGYTFDNIRLVDPGTDFEVSAITSPSGNCMTSTSHTLTVSVKNNAAVGVSNVPIRYSINGGAPVSDIVPSVAAGATVSYSFPSTISLTGQNLFNIRVWVDWAGPTPVSDGNRDNDTLAVTVATAINTFPFLHTLEENNGAFTVSGTNSTWQWGAPSPFNAIVNQAASGNRVWATNLGGEYVNNENSQITSACMNLSGSFSNPGNLPVLSFSLSGATEPDYDFLWVEYSTDGTTWTKLGELNGANSTNWYNRGANNTWHANVAPWKVVSYIVPGAAISATTRFRLRFTSDGSVTAEGVAIDNFHIHFNNKIHNSGGDVFGQTVSSTGSGNWLNFNNAGNERIAAIRDVSNMGTVSLDVRQTTGAPRMFNSQYYMNRNFKISPSTAPNTPVPVRLFFMENELLNLAGSDGAVKSYINVKVNKYSGPAENLTPNDNPLTPTNYTYFESPVLIPYHDGYYAEFTTNGFSEFYLSGGEFVPDAPLPLVAGSFEAIALRDKAKLWWKVMPGHQIGQFVIERSFDGRQFSTVGSLGAKPDMLDYQYFDERKSQIAYYRIGFKNQTGNMEYSAIRRISWIDEIDFQVFPNPASEEVFIRSNAEVEEVVLINALGQFVQLQPKGRQDGYQKEYPLPALPTGVYTLKIKVENQWHQKRISVK